MKNAVAYLRVSGAGQVDGDGFGRQLAAIEEFARTHDYNLSTAYREEGVSGKTDDMQRPVMSAMIDYLSTRADEPVILIEKMDRLARDLIIQEGIISKIRKLGFEIVSTMEPDLCSDDPSRKFIRRVLGAVAELDRDLIVAKTRAARERIRARGERCEGRKPYGFKPGEEKIVGLILNLASNGTNYASTAKYLNLQGIRTRSGGFWRAMQVRRVLHGSKANTGQTAIV